MNALEAAILVNGVIAAVKVTVESGAAGRMALIGVATAGPTSVVASASFV